MAKTLQNKRVLIIEDDKFLADLLSKKLESEGAEVLYANSGESFLKSMGGKIPTLAIIDILLPGFDGFETLRRIRMQDKLQSVPAILLSNVDRGEYENKLAASKNTKLLMKSRFNLDELVVQIEKFLAENNEA